MFFQNYFQRLTGLFSSMLFNSCAWIVSVLACMPTVTVGQAVDRTNSASPVSNGIIEPAALAGDPLQFEQTMIVDRRIEEINSEIASVKATAERADEDMKSLEKQIKFMGLTSSNQMVLVETRRRIPSISENQLKIKAISDELEQINLEVHRLECRNPIDQSAKLIERYNEYRVRLSNLSVEREKLITKIELLQQYLNGQLIWVRDCQPLGVAEFKQTTAGVAALLAPRQWQELGNGLAERILVRPYELGLLVIGLVAISFAKRWLTK
jgi:hypothetical protein